MRAARSLRRRVFAAFRSMPIETRAFGHLADDVRLVIAGRCEAHSQYPFTTDPEGRMIPRVASPCFRSSLRTRCEAVSRG